MQRQCKGDVKRGEKRTGEKGKEEEGEIPNFFPRSFEIYLPVALAEYDCYSAFKTFWIQRAPDRLPTYTSLPDVLSLLKRHDIECDSVKVLEITPPRQLVSLEEIMRSHGSQFI